jgi:hypothetical protein
MKTIALFALMLGTLLPAFADFSYTITRKGSGGQSSGKQYFKGHQMMTDDGDTGIVIDFDAKTITNINKMRHTYTVVPFSQVGAGIPGAASQAKVDVKETGLTKNIGGFNAHQVMMTIDSNTQAPGQGSMQLQIEMEWWLSNDVPGAGEVKAFYERHGDEFPWTALTSAMGPAGQTVAEGMRKVMKSGGVPVLQIVRSKMLGGPTVNPQQQAQMDQARARLQAMAQAGGAQGAAAQQALQSMAARGGGAGGGSEQTSESSGFSTNSIPDSVFAVPAGYLKN